MDKNSYNKTKFNNESLKNENSYSNFKNEKRNYDYAYSYELGKEYAEDVEYYENNMYSENNGFNNLENSTEKYKNDYNKKCNCREHKKKNKKFLK